MSEIADVGDRHKKKAGSQDSRHYFVVLHGEDRWGELRYQEKACCNLQTRIRHVPLWTIVRIATVAQPSSSHGYLARCGACKTT